MDSVSRGVEYLVTAFDALKNTLSVVQRVEGSGPHQYVGINQARDRVYTTTWALPPTLAAWSIEPPANSSAHPSVELINTVNITATSSYISVTDNAVYSAGGPTGEVHKLDARTRGFGEQIQRLYYVPEESLPDEDKTRVALRNGSHGIDISSQNRAFVPHLGYNSIFMYSLNDDHSLSFISETKSHAEHDGPRHNIPSPDGRYLYVVTEHSSEVDVYEVKENELLNWIQRVSVLPAGTDSGKYRGDTLRLSSDAEFLFATTRGSSTETLGYASVWSRDYETGKLSPDALDRYQTPTSGGKANAIELMPRKQTEDDDIFSSQSEKLVLTDDVDGLVVMLEWDGEVIKEIARTRLPDGSTASHCVWL